ncbi:unnamed protein product, partial [Arabidopsis halleri]
LLSLKTFQRERNFSDQSPNRRPGFHSGFAPGQGPVPFPASVGFHSGGGWLQSGFLCRVLIVLVFRNNPLDFL